MRQLPEIKELTHEELTELVCDMRLAITTAMNQLIMLDQRLMKLEKHPDIDMSF
jgi:hypothetical protein